MLDDDRLRHIAQKVLVCAARDAAGRGLLSGSRARLDTALFRAEAAEDWLRGNGGRGVSVDVWLAVAGFSEGYADELARLAKEERLGRFATRQPT